MESVSVYTLKFDSSKTAAPFTSIYRTMTSTALVDRNRPHFHPNTLEICALVHGHQDWTVAEETYALRPGDVLILPQGVVHGSVDSNLQPCELIAVHLAPEQLPPRLVEPALALTARRTRQPAIIELIGRVIREHEREEAYLAEIAAALGTLLVTSLVNLEADHEEMRNSRLIRQAQRAMMGRKGVRPTIGQVASGLGISSVWLTKLFVRETGFSPGDWARAKRLTQAKRLLEAGRLSTVEIAFELGYASGQSFATAFRQESGMTPTEYRELHHKPEAERAPTVYRVDTREVWQ
ncbi:MAG: helix-turn-helix domain-containing protein [Fimbriimonas sp.]